MPSWDSDSGLPWEKRGSWLRWASLGSPFGDCNYLVSSSWELMADSQIPLKTLNSCEHNLSMGVLYWSIGASPEGSKGKTSQLYVLILTNAGALMKLSKYLGAAQGVLGGIIWIMLFFSYIMWSLLDTHTHTPFARSNYVYVSWRVLKKKRNLTYSKDLKVDMT